MHGHGLAVHVHEADAAGPMRRDHLQRARLAQRPDVVDDEAGRHHRERHAAGQEDDQRELAANRQIAERWHRLHLAARL